MEDFDEMLKMYPEIILISKSPHTWKGLLSVTNKHNNCKMKVKVKLVVPLSPQLDNATVLFGDNIAVLFGLDFKNQIESAINKSESVPSFFQELTTIIETLLYNKQENDLTDYSSMLTVIKEKLLRELELVLSEYSDVEISSTKDLSAIKFTLNDISIVVKPTVISRGRDSWKLISSDLPELPGKIFNEKKPVTLREIRKKFQQQVLILEDVWNQLRKIDSFCSVIDPIHPKPYHLYRRIYLSPSVSLLLTLNPMDPTGYPNIKFLGIKSEVDKYRKIIQNENTIDNWDLDCSVYENLLTLLNIDEFPQISKIDQSIEEKCVVGDEECCICFSMEMENGKLPDQICNNFKCQRHFHSDCLFQWLQELATNQIVFNKIFGPCPNCNEQISCDVPK